MNLKDMPQKIHASIACNLDTNILLAALPLFQAEKVQAIEWSFDTLFNHKNIPDWFVELLQEFSRANRLIGHGVFFSLFSGRWSAEQEKWLQHLKKVSNNFQFDHITEHFGFMTGEDFHKGAPISIPFTKSTLAIGQDRLKRIYEACQCPVGLENLAFSYSIDEVKKHGDFLNQLLEPINGFIILDLHNLYCQLHNFQIDYKDLILLYPLDKVREIHISGGSWADSSILPERQIRRDTHDDSVPEEVFQLLERTMKKCPNLKYVVLEQLGTGLKNDKSKSVFQKDFLRLNSLVEKQNLGTTSLKTTVATGANSSSNTFLPNTKVELGEPVEDEILHQQQMELSEILETSINYEAVQNRLQESSLAKTAWGIEEWEPYMVETVYEIAQKWKKGF